MSISPLHGGLIFQEDANLTKVISAAPEEEKKSAGVATSVLDLNNRDINEFYNPRVSELSLDERVRMCLQVGEEVI